jgi:hypothetical protein
MSEDLIIPYELERVCMYKFSFVGIVSRYELLWRVFKAFVRPFLNHYSDHLLVLPFLLINLLGLRQVWLAYHSDSFDQQNSVLSSTLHLASNIKQWWLTLHFWCNHPNCSPENKRIKENVIKGFLLLIFKFAFRVSLSKYLLKDFWKAKIINVYNVY